MSTIYELDPELPQKVFYIVHDVEIVDMLGSFVIGLPHSSDWDRLYEGPFPGWILATAAGDP
jgi:hypothetical protein